MNKAPQFKLGENKDYLQDHVGNNLQWLFRSATEWYIQKKLNLCLTGYEVQVYAIGSAFMRARAIFEFLTEDNSKKDGRFYYTLLDFGLSNPLVSNLYTKHWKSQFHSHAGIHLQNRDNKQELKTVDGSSKTLNEMPLDFAGEIHRLWKEFTEKLGNPELKSIAEALLSEAISNADNVRKSINTNARNRYPKNCKLFPNQII